MLEHRDEFETEAALQHRPVGIGEEEHEKVDQRQRDAGVAIERIGVKPQISKPQKIGGEKGKVQAEQIHQREAEVGSHVVPGDSLIHPV